MPYQDKDGMMVADEVPIVPAVVSESRSAEVIPEPAPGSRTVFIGNVLPFFRGKGNITIICGSCNLPLIQDIMEGQITNVVIKCPNCDSYNDIQ